MKPLIQSSREEVYEAPTIPWNNGTYTPISNMFIMDMILHKLNNAGLTVRSDEYKAARTKEGLVKGVIGTYDIAADDNDFGQRLVFRNSYDKSMSFAFAVGTVVFCCSNGCIKGDYQYKRVHRGVMLEESSTTQEAIIEVNHREIDGFTFSTNHKLCIVHPNTYTLAPSIFQSLAVGMVNI